MPESTQYSARIANSSEGHAGYAEWLAVGAVVAGSIGAIVGAAKCAQRSAGPSRLQVERPASASLTAPHGDKLSPAL
jgi:hypothetical protein